MHGYFRTSHEMIGKRQKSRPIAWLFKKTFDGHQAAPE